VGDLQGTGYNDTIVVGSGYYYTPTDGRIAILDKNGNALQMITNADLPGTVYSLALDGTDIYAGMQDGTIEKFYKSGSTWVRDTTHGWPQSIGGTYVRDIHIADVGNGKRVFAVSFGGNKMNCFLPDGTIDWQATTANYSGPFEIGNVDSSITGDEIIAPYQGGVKVFDKDGNLVGTITTGTNVHESVTLYDSDGNGEDEIYYTDFGDDLYSSERTGTNTYSLKYSLLNQTQDAEITHYDIDGDGEDEIIAGTTDGHLKVFSADLSTTKSDINIGQGVIGGYSINYSRAHNGIVYSDINGDGHADILVSASNGYMFAYEASGFSAPVDNTPARTMRLFEGFKIKFISGVLKLFGQ
jgi:hypothetical protein